MPNWLTRPLVLATLVALLQTGALAAMILDRARHIATGREIVLPVIPVDPRSLFRGDYVILNYEISRAPVPDGTPTRDGEVLYVTLEPRTADGKPGWTAVATSRSYPSGVGGDRIVLQGWQAGPAWRSTGGIPELRVRYGIESYFVPEGTGRDLEKKVESGAIAVIAAIDGTGRAAIKGLVLDGQVRYDEPLF